MFSKVACCMCINMHAPMGKDNDTTDRAIIDIDDGSITRHTEKIKAPKSAYSKEQTADYVLTCAYRSHKSNKNTLIYHFAMSIQRMLQEFIAKKMYGGLPIYLNLTLTTSLKYAHLLSRQSPTCLQWILAVIYYHANQQINMSYQNQTKVSA